MRKLQQRAVEERSLAASQARREVEDELGAQHRLQLAQREEELRMAKQRAEAAERRANDLSRQVQEVRDEAKRQQAESEAKHKKDIEDLEKRQALDKEDHQRALGALEDSRKRAEQRAEQSRKELQEAAALEQERLKSEAKALEDRMNALKEAAEVEKKRIEEAAGEKQVALSQEHESQQRRLQAEIERAQKDREEKLKEAADAQKRAADEQAQLKQRLKEAREEEDRKLREAEEEARSRLQQSVQRVQDEKAAAIKREEEQRQELEKRLNEAREAQAQATNDLREASHGFRVAAEMKSRLTRASEDLENEKKRNEELEDALRKISRKYEEEQRAAAEARHVADELRRQQNASGTGSVGGSPTAVGLPSSSPRYGDDASQDGALQTWQSQGARRPSMPPTGVGSAEGRAIAEVAERRSRFAKRQPSLAQLVSSVAGRVDHAAIGRAETSDSMRRAGLPHGGQSETPGQPTASPGGARKQQQQQQQSLLKRRPSALMALGLASKGSFRDSKPQVSPTTSFRGRVVSSASSGSMTSAREQARGPARPVLGHESVDPGSPSAHTRPLGSADHSGASSGEEAAARDRSLSRGGVPGPARKQSSDMYNSREVPRVAPPPPPRAQQKAQPQQQVTASAAAEVLAQLQQQLGALAQRGGDSASPVALPTGDDAGSPGGSSRRPTRSASMSRRRGEGTVARPGSSPRASVSGGTSPRSRSMRRTSSRRSSSSPRGASAKALPEDLAVVSSFGTKPSTSPVSKKEAVAQKQQRMRRRDSRRNWGAVFAEQTDDTAQPDPVVMQISAAQAVEAAARARKEAIEAEEKAKAKEAKRMRRRASRRSMSQRRIDEEEAARRGPARAGSRSRLASSGGGRGGRSRRGGESSPIAGGGSPTGESAEVLALRQQLERKEQEAKEAKMREQAMQRMISEQAISAGGGAEEEEEEDDGEEGEGDYDDEESRDPAAEMRREAERAARAKLAGNGSVASSVYSSHVHGFTNRDAGSPSGAGAAGATRRRSPKAAVTGAKAAELDALEK